MNVNTQSIIYKFMNEGFILCDEHIPDNLCPYMRRFVKGVLLTFLLFFSVVWVALSMLILPFFVLLGQLVEPYIALTFVAGTLGYIVLFGNLVVYFFKRTATQSALRKATNTAGDVVVRAWDATTDSLFSQWIKAIHDKVCPTLTFTAKWKAPKEIV